MTPANREPADEVGPRVGNGRDERHTARDGVSGRGSLLLKVMTLALLVAAGAWALYANLRSGRPAMDMSMRVTSGQAPFPVVLGGVERGPITGTVTYTGSVAPLNEEDISSGGPTSGVQSVGQGSASRIGHRGSRSGRACAVGAPPPRKLASCPGEAEPSLVRHTDPSAPSSWPPACLLQIRR